MGEFVKEESSPSTKPAFEKEPEKVTLPTLTSTCVTDEQKLDKVTLPTHTSICVYNDDSMPTATPKPPATSQRSCKAEDESSAIFGVLALGILCGCMLCVYYPPSEPCCNRLANQRFLQHNAEYLVEGGQMMFGKETKLTDSESYNIIEAQYNFEYANGHRIFLMHDFKANQTLFKRTNLHSTCYIRAWSRESNVPSETFSDMVRKTNSRYYQLDLKRKSTFYIPYITDLSPISKRLVDNCRSGNVLMVDNCPLTICKEGNREAIMQPRFI